MLSEMLDGTHVEASMPAPGDGVRSVTFETTGRGLEVTDRIDRKRYVLRTPTRVAPEAVDTDAFRFPVDAAVAIETERIVLPTVVAVCLRDADGTMLANAEHFADMPFDGDVSIELCAPIRLYLRLSGAGVVRADAEHTRIEFEGPTELFVGARSKHEYPVATITTTEEPADLMTAVSTFGSALKTTSPERSYPTFRGHPPAIELADELSIPEGLDRPETGLEIEIPEKYRYVFVAAPLAYYFGARVVPGPTPRLVGEGEVLYEFDESRFEDQVGEVLKHAFFLDCVTRTEGLYRVDLHERRRVENTLDVDFAALYEMPIAERLRAYLEIPHEEIEPSLPDWKLTAHVSTRPESAETLPFLVNDLALIRTPRHIAETASTAEVTAVNDFLRDSFVRSTSSAPVERSYVQPETTDSIEQVWIGEETPIGASKATTEAYRNRFGRSPESGSIEITVVCNDEQMDEERSVVDEVYGSRTELPFDVTVEHDLSTDELADLLRESADFFHYIGHIDEHGFECSDGSFDATTLDSVGVDAFMLNACESYEQGMALIERGAIGGIVTLERVVNTGAMRIGGTLARLLNCGFPLRAALEVARGDNIVGTQYLVIGDGGMTIAQSPSGTPNLCKISRRERGYSVTIEAHASTSGGMGGLVKPHIENNQEFFLNTGTLSTFEVSKKGLSEFLSLEEIPVIVNGALYWSDDIDTSVVDSI
jgi:hypothetical protein